MAKKRGSLSHLPDSVQAVWLEAAAALEGAPPVVVECYAGQLAVIRKARAVVEAEGLTVVDGRGNTVAHPALAIERDAAGQLLEIAQDWVAEDDE